MQITKDGMGRGVELESDGDYIDGEYCMHVYHSKLEN